MADPASLAAAFDIFNRVRVQSPTLERIWQAGFGDDYANEARPNAFYPQSVLDQIINAFGDVKATDALLDVGTGHGGPGIYLASQLDMGLRGIDLSPIGIETAQDYAALHHPDLRAEFWVADVTSTGLEDGSCAAGICLDVMIFFPDKLAALKEIARVLVPGGLFAFTTWEQHGFNARLESEQTEDYRPLLQQAGFEVLSYEKLSNVQRMQERTFHEMVAGEQALKDEIGEKAASMLTSMARSGLEEAAARIYMFGIARRR